ncbi:MAG TPA: cytochrome c [Anaerolineaceae bacterium]
MKKIVFVVMVVLALALAACGGGAANETSAVEVPADYAGKTNPVANDAAAATAGQEIYTTNCASCHGDTGAGDGAAGAALDPKPAALNALSAEKNDAYLFWRISEGGMMEPFNSSMPAFKGVLSEDQIWQVVTYIHTLAK